jgi:hypothetical protein
MKRKRVLWAGLIIVLISLLLHIKGLALIPEPPNIIYGSVEVGGTPLNSGTVTIRLVGEAELIASYVMGSIPQAGDNYVLQVPLDALDPQTPGTARPGDAATIYVNDQPAETIVVGERGSVQIVDIDLIGVDTDHDGLPDNWEQQIIDANPNDDIEFIEDVWPLDDFDEDGFCNIREYLSNSNPALTADIPNCWTDIYFDFDVDGEDLAILSSEIGRDDCSAIDPCECDFDSDGDVDDMDLLFFSEDHGRNDCL